jgi:hypothetical protein
MSTNPSELDECDPDSDMDQEFLNAMNGDDSQDLDSKDEEDAEQEDESEGEGENKLIKGTATAPNNFLEILGEDILIRICSTLSASHLCEFAKTSRWCDSDCLLCA